MQNLATSGVVVVPNTITPLIASANCQVSAVLHIDNTGGQIAIIEMAFSADGGVTFPWSVSESVPTNEATGVGVAAGTSLYFDLPDNSPDYVRVRGKAAAASTNIRVDLLAVNSFKRSR